MDCHHGADGATSLVPQLLFGAETLDCCTFTNFTHIQVNNKNINILTKTINWKGFEHASHNHSRSLVKGASSSQSVRTN